MDSFSMVEQFPSYRFYKAFRLYEKGEGFPGVSRLFQWANYPQRNPDHLIQVLGQNNVKLQSHDNDCAAAAVTMLLERMQIPVSEELIYDKLDHGPEGGQISLLEIKDFLGELGINSNGWEGTLQDLKREMTPIILHFDDRHFVVLSTTMEEGFIILDPSIGRLFLTNEELNKSWKGVYFRVEQI